MFKSLMGFPAVGMNELEQHITQSPSSLTRYEEVMGINATHIRIHLLRSMSLGVQKIGKGEQQETYIKHIQGIVPPMFRSNDSKTNLIHMCTKNV